MEVEDLCPRYQNNLLEIDEAHYNRSASSVQLPQTAQKASCLTNLNAKDYAELKDRRKCGKKNLGTNHFKHPW